MKFLLKKSCLFSIMAGSAVLLTACGDDTSSNNQAATKFTASSSFSAGEDNLIARNGQDVGQLTVDTTASSTLTVAAALYTMIFSFE